MTYAIYLLLVGLMAGAYVLADRSKAPRPVVWIPLIVLALTTALFLFDVSAPDKLFKDFLKSYYPAGELLWVDPAEMYRKGVGGFVNLPLLAAPFTPISHLQPESACAIMALLSIGALLASMFMLFRMGDFHGKGRLVLVCLFLVNGPLYYSLREGNLTHIIFPLMILALVCLGRGWEVPAGLLLALCGAIKLPLLLFVVYLAARGRWKAFASAMLFMGGLVAASVGIFGQELHAIWLDRAVLPFMGRPIAAYNVECVDGFLARLFRPNNLLNFGPLDMGAPFSVLRWSARAILLGLAGFAMLRSGPPRSRIQLNSEFCIVLLLALLLSPVSWTHYYLFLLLPLALAVGRALPRPRVPLETALLCAAAVLVSLPNTPMTLPAWVGRGQLSNMLVSRFFFGGLLLLGVLLVRHARTGAAAASQQGGATRSIPARQSRPGETRSRSEDVPAASRKRHDLDQSRGARYRRRPWSRLNPLRGESLAGS